MTMTTKQQKYIEGLVQEDIDRATDNIVRARARARVGDSTREYGESGRTLNDIIEGYQKAETEVSKTLEAFRRARLHHGGRDED